MFALHFSYTQSLVFPICYSIIRMKLNPILSLKVSRKHNFSCLSFLNGKLFHLNRSPFI